MISIDIWISVIRLIVKTRVVDPDGVYPDLNHLPEKLNSDPSIDKNPNPDLTFEKQLGSEFYLILT